MTEGFVEIHREPIAAGGRKGRREAERNAAQRIARRIFGPDAAIAHREDGSPYLPSRPDLHISISHCQDECVLAISDRPVGVDVETARPQLAKVASKFLTATESSRGPHDLKVLLMYWTAKEATFKCASDPTLVISEIEVSDDMASVTARGRRYDITITLTPGKALAVAHPAR